MLQQQSLAELLLLLLVVATSAQQASIVVPPKSVNIAVNATANFTCTAIAEEIAWEVNGQPVDSDLRSRGFNNQAVPLTLLNATQNLYTRTLSVFGSADNNGSNIICAAYFLPPSLSINISEPAVLLVFEPGPVSDLTVVSINSTTVLISWSPPFTLEGVPILGYNVTITNTTSGKNETMSVEGDTTMLYYSIDHPDPDNNFTVTVVPINGAGPGEDAVIMFVFLQVDQNSIISSTVMISSHDVFLPSTKPPSAVVGTVSTHTMQPTLTSQHLILITSTVLLSTMTPNSPVIIPIVVSVSVVTMVTIVSAVVVAVTCYLLIRKHKLTAAKFQPQDVVPVSANPAYEQVTSIALQENSAYSIVHTVSPPAAAAAEYENIGDRKHGNDKLTATKSPPQQDDEVPVSANPAYRHVTSIALQENSAYSIVPAQYENIGDRKHVNDQLTAANSSPQYEVPVSANPAYGQVTSIALQENSAYSIVHCTYHQQQQ